MLSLPVTDPTLKRLLLEHVIEQLDQGGEKLDTLLSMGMEPSFLDRLRRTQSRDLMLIAQWDLDIQVGFGDGSISASLDRVHAIRRDTELAEYFVRNGASTELMVTLFRIARDDVRALRKALAVEASEAVGRPKLPPIEKRELVHRDWLDIQRTCFVDSMRERYFALHQRHPDLTIGAMVATLSEHGDISEGALTPADGPGAGNDESKLGHGGTRRTITRTAVSKS
ncbi:MAG: STY4526/YPO1902 family pathogenicity island replication protein [Roseateles sp.]|jgi:hypothetical protein|nr:hypothetical protein [Methylibium sp.]|mmetsp:Transcript_53262/g.124807  ORF Transcript_53262/g.124807 Transcript_53262/m.124807 type:complete len:226 (+) Transcript_53262:1055-1732(+)